MKHRAVLSAALVIGLMTATSALDVRANTINLGEGHTPSISSDGQGHLSIVFESEDNGTGASDIYYSTSSDGGLTWSKRMDVSPTSGVSTRPRVAVEKSGAINVVWTDTTRGENNPDIFFTRSTDSGHTWNTPINISHTPGASRDPELAIGKDGTIHVAFVDTPASSGSRDIFYAFSTDGGKNWTKNQQLENVSNTATDSSEPSITVAADGIVHVAWKEENTSSTNKPHIYYSKRSQSGWSSFQNISNNNRYSYHPVIGCGSNGNIYINWLDRATRDEASDIWCVAINSSGEIGQPVHVSNSGSITSAAEMKSDANNRVAIVWPDNALGTGTPKIRLKVLSNTSTTANKTTDLAHSSEFQLAPALSMNGDRLTIVWEERSLTDNPIKVKSIDLR